MQVLFFFLLPLAGLLGYWLEVSWLYYTASILSLLFVLIFGIVAGNLSKGNMVRLLAYIVVCWILAHSFIDGVLLGACLHLIINEILTIIYYSKSL